MLKKLVKCFINREVLMFLLVGGTNTILSMTIMLILYNKFHKGYWISSFTAYVLTAILGFILNRKYTFRSEESIVSSGCKFFLVIITCYIIAYSIAKPLVLVILSGVNNRTIEFYSDQIAMLLGQIIFTLLNYLGQKFFAFKNRK